MNAEQLQFIFSLFSFVGVVGILFYIILERAKQEERKEELEHLEEKITSLQEYVHKLEEQQEESREPVEEENLKEKIIALYEDGKELSLIEDRLNIPKAKIEMVLKFHNLKKSDNWRNSVNENL